MGFFNGYNINYLYWDGRIPPATLGSKPYPDVRYADSLHTDQLKINHDSRLRSGSGRLPYRNNLSTKVIPMWNQASQLPGVNKFSYDYSSGHAQVLIPIETIALTNDDIPTSIDCDLNSLVVSFQKTFEGVTYNNVTFLKEPNAFTVTGEYDETHATTIDGTGIRFVSAGDIYMGFYIRFQVTPENKILIRLDIDSPDGANTAVLEDKSITLTFVFNKTVTPNLPQLTLNFITGPKLITNPTATLLVNKPIQKYHIFYLNESIEFCNGSDAEAALRKVVEDHYLIDNYVVSNKNHMYSYYLKVLAYNDPNTGKVGWFDLTNGWSPPDVIFTTGITDNPMPGLLSLLSTFPTLREPVTNDNYEIVGEITIIENYNTNNHDGYDKSYVGSMDFGDFPTFKSDRLTVNLAGLFTIDQQRLFYYQSAFTLPDQETRHWVNSTPQYNNNYCDFRYLAAKGVTHDTIKRPVVVPADLERLGLSLYLDDYRFGSSSIRAIDITVDGLYGAFTEHCAIPTGSVSSNEYICLSFGNESRLFLIPSSKMIWLSVSEPDYPDFMPYDSPITIQVKYTYANGVTAITDFTTMTVDNALADIGSMPEDWLTFNLPWLD